MKNLILGIKEDYTLIARVNEETEEVHEFVVAWCFKPDGTWSQGHYFPKDSLVQATQFMQEKKSDLYESRYELLRQMNNFVIQKLDDETAYMTWINLVPDEASDEDLKEIALENDSWIECCTLFGELVKQYT